MSSTFPSLKIFPKLLQSDVLQRVLRFLRFFETSRRSPRLQDILRRHLLRNFTYLRSFSFQPLSRLFRGAERGEVKEPSHSFKNQRKDPIHLCDLPAKPSQVECLPNTAFAAFSTSWKRSAGSPSRSPPWVPTVELEAVGSRWLSSNEGSNGVIVGPDVWIGGSGAGGKRCSGTDSLRPPSTSCNRFLSSVHSGCELRFPSAVLVGHLRVLRSRIVNVVIVDRDHHFFADFALVFLSLRALPLPLRRCLLRLLRLLRLPLRRGLLRLLRLLSCFLRRSSNSRA